MCVCVQYANNFDKIFGNKNKKGADGSEKAAEEKTDASKEVSGESPADAKKTEE